MTTDWKVCCAEWMLRRVLKRSFMALCTDMSSSQKSVVTLSSVLFDTYFNSEMSLPIEKLSQCRR